MSNTSVTVYAVDKVAVLASDRAEALGTEQNRQLDVVNEAQAIGLPVNGARVFDARDADALGMDRMSEIEAETGGGLYYVLNFYREPEPGESFDEFTDEDLADVIEAVAGVDLKDEPEAPATEGDGGTEEPATEGDAPEPGDTPEGEKEVPAEEGGEEPPAEGPVEG